MFDIFKQDIKIGDKIKLYLTTGKEPEGVVTQIGNNFVLLTTEDKIQNRFFDKLIGGWDVINKTVIIDKPKPIIDPNIDRALIINKKLIIENIDSLLNLNDKFILIQNVEPNANIVAVRETTCVATNNEFSKILILNNKIVDLELITEIESFMIGSIIPIVVQYYSKKKNEAMATVAVKPNNIENYLHKILVLVEDEKFTEAYILSHILKPKLKNNYFFRNISRELKKSSSDILNMGLAKINIRNPENVDDKKIFKIIEKDINNLIRNSKFELALHEINEELKGNTLEDKYKSSLLLKKAQIFSSLNNPDASEKAYLELVAFNEKIKSPPNNLSHLYTELARLQAIKPDKQQQALDSVKKALRYNPNNNFALNLLKQFEGRTDRDEVEKSINESLEEHLIIDTDEDSGNISKMIDVDIKEHKYSHPEIIRNGGKPTSFIAKKILEEAKQTRDTDLSERYPIYLEAAKAFSELNVGSYDLQDYLESSAYYSMLKGNSLFINFRNKVFNNEIDIIKLTRLRDSARSYYIESLNLLSNIEPKFLVTILANYLKLNIAIYYIENKFSFDYKLIFKGNFKEVFENCLRNKNRAIEIIAYDTILSCGASSIQAWNKLSLIPNGISRLYGEFGNEANKIRIFELINEIESTLTDIRKTPSEFLKATFQQRKKKEILFIDSISKLFNIDLEPHNIDALLSQWKQLDGFEKLLTNTDKETKNEIDKLLSILQPYLNRRQSERTNILIQVRKIIETQVKFINDNTTFYGRTFFYGLLNKWKRDIDILIEEKIAQSYPALNVSIDPPYYIETNGEITAPIIIKNEGEATSEGFTLKIMYKSAKYKEKIIIPYDSDIEIASGSKFEMSLLIPKDLVQDYKALELIIDIEAKYQKNKVSLKHHQFTIENEPTSVLSYDDIPWRDGPIPPEHLFKGRKQLIADLAQHYLSIEKDKPYILYGLTRTGKSSVLEYLRQNLAGDTFYSNRREMKIITFSWELSEAASYKKASDFWAYILYQQTFKEMVKYSSKFQIDITELDIKENVRAKDFRRILDYLQAKNIYPIFFVDEFSFIKTLIDDGTINSAFLHTLRQFSLSELASFIFAGTYDIKTLIKDPKYGITGQLVNAIEEQVNEISDASAKELIEVINDKLSFTSDAIKHIKFLSGNVPYFIQIICKHCGYYAAENQRRYIGYPELEKVIKILIGQEPSPPKSLVKKLPENIFQNNQFSPADPKEVAVLISSITYFNKDRIEDPRGIGFAELQKLWADKRINAFRPRLADAINLLMEKKIIAQGEDEGMPVYKLSVDLFRRWWTIHYPDINLTLTTLTE